MPSLSERLWELDWSGVLPWTIGEVTIEHGSFDEVEPFLREHHERLFGPPDSRFYPEETTPAKRRFWAESDVFVFRSEGKMIGYWSGHPSDWSSYYCRTMSFLPEFREAHLATELSTRIIETLSTTECARIEVDTSIANVPMQRMLLGLRFVVTSTSVSERWGTMLRFTRLLREDAARVFARQYVYVPEFGRNPKERRGP